MAIDERATHRELMQMLKQHGGMMRRNRIKSAYGKKAPQGPESPALVGSLYPDGSPEHEGRESRHMEQIEHATGVEAPDEGKDKLSDEDLALLLTSMKGG